MKRGAAIYGAGGHARVVASIILARGFDFFGFFDNYYSGAPENIQGARLMGRLEDIHNYREQISDFYIAIGNNEKRAEYFHILKEMGFRLPPLVHPTAIVENSVPIGDGTVICLGAIICTGTKLGQGCLVNTGSSLDHESVLDDFVHLAPRVAVAGRTQIGAGTFVGMGSIVAEYLTIGRNVTIGASSVILRNVADGDKVNGVYHGK